MTDKTLTVMALTLGLFSAKPAHADVGPGISAPPPVIASAVPAAVAIPGSPVSHVPSAAYNLFLFGGRYYSLHNGTWFMTTAPRSPWSAVAAGRMPRPVLAVPATYYKVPPGQAKLSPGQARKAGGSHPAAVPVGATIADPPGREGPRP
jgi:hypothetical protein